MANQKKFIRYLIKNTKLFSARYVKFNEDSFFNCSDCEIEIIEDKLREEQNVH
jgi:hypothetical protein